MSKRSKRFIESEKLIDRTKTYGLEQAIEALLQMPRAKFDETVELSFRLGVDPKKSDQMVRGTITLPHGTGKSRKVAVFCKGEAAKVASSQGADFVGTEDLIRKIQSGWLGFDVAIATPEMMKEVSKLGRILGPRGLMPNPKAGTVTQDIAGALSEIKKGKVEFKTDRQAGIHVGIGKISFKKDALYENASSMIDAIISQKPSQVKGRYLKVLTISTTMGPGIKLNLDSLKKG